MKDECKADADGNCQHAANTGPRSWTIPLGTHIIGGRTVSTIFSTDSAATNPQNNEEQPKDNLVKDLIKMSFEFDIDGLMDQKKYLDELVPYIVARDHKILDHGIKVGKGQK